MIKRFEAESTAAALDTAGVLMSGGVWEMRPVTEEPQVRLVGLGGHDFAQQQQALRR